MTVLEFVGKTKTRGYHLRFLNADLGSGTKPAATSHPALLDYRLLRLGNLFSFSKRILWEQTAAQQTESAALRPRGDVSPAEIYDGW